MKLYEFLELKGYRFLTRKESDLFNIPRSCFEREGYLETFGDNELDDSICHKIIYEYKKDHLDLCFLVKKMIEKFDKILDSIGTPAVSGETINRAQWPNGNAFKKKSKKQKKIRLQDKWNLPMNANREGFLDSFHWRKTRMEALKRSDGRCECCGKSKKDGAVLNVDHIKPRQTHPELALAVSNLQVLCSECNHGKGNWDKTNWRDKPISTQPEVIVKKIIIRKKI